MPVDPAAGPGAGPGALVLVAHGSRDPRAERSTRALVEAVRRASAAEWGRIDAAFLDFTQPRLGDALDAARSTAARSTAARSTAPAGAVVVPLLLTAAYHGRVDVPAEIERAEAGSAGAVRLAEVLGPVGGRVLDRVAVELTVAALLRRLTEAGARRADGVVLVAAGSRRDGALAVVDLVADAVGTALGRPCRVGYASGVGPDPAAAVAALAGDGARGIAVASYFLAPGRLHDRAVGQARSAGAAAVADPLGDAPEVVELVRHRAAAARPVAALAG
jgi:sirohydrochlorin ferrochelatase